MPKHIQQPSAAAEIRRQHERALAEVRSAEFGSTIGRLHCLGKLTAAQYVAGKRYAALVSDYASAVQAPKPPATCQLDRDHGGRPADIDSDNGRKEASRHRRVVEACDEMRAALRRFPHVESILDAIVVQDRAPSGPLELAALKRGLDVLGVHWEARRKAARY